MKEGILGKLALVACISAGSGFAAERFTSVVAIQNNKRAPLSHIVNNINDASNYLSPDVSKHPNFGPGNRHRPRTSGVDYYASQGNISSVMFAAESSIVDTARLNVVYDSLSTPDSSGEIATEAQVALSEVAAPIKEEIKRLDRKSYIEAGEGVGVGLFGLGILVHRLRRRGKTNKTEYAQLMELLIAYPDIHVSRDALGNIGITQNLGHEGVRRILVSDKYDVHGEEPSVEIRVTDRIDISEYQTVGAEDMYLNLTTDDRGTVNTEVVRNRTGLDVQQVLQKTRQGFDLLSSYLNTDLSSRGRYANFVNDELEGQTVEDRMAQTGEDVRAKILEYGIQNDSTRHEFLGKKVREACVA